MDKVLFVVDMQEMYVGRGRDKTTYSYDAESLIDAINKRISCLLYTSPSPRDTR